MHKRMIGVLCLLATAAAAQPATDIEQVWLDPAARGSLLVGNGTTLPQAKFRAGASLLYTFGNLRSSNDLVSTPALAHRGGVQIFGAVGIFNWLEVGANVPVYFIQQGSESLNVTSAGLGNPWLHAKVNILDATKPIALAIDLGVGIPVGFAQGAQVNGGFQFAPRVQIGKVYSDWQFGAEVGFLFRPATDYGSTLAPIGPNGTPDIAGHQLWVGGMVSTVNRNGPRGELSVRAFAPIGNAGNPGVEAQVGLRWPIGPVEVFATAGPGLFGEPTTPLFRTYLGFAFGNEPMMQPPCIEGQPYDVTSCPDLDLDGDGVKNGVDKAPSEPEDKDGFQDEDGAPEADNDNDGVKDEADKCRDVAGVKENDGCPDTDADNDGIVDRLDKCADKAEDKDGFEDTDGCPEADNDGDGIADEVDACRDVAGIAQEKGCPAKDEDKDGVANHEDNCPTEAGVKENQGCPAAKKQLVVITAEKLKILDRVYFDNGKATIQKKSFGLLDNLAAVLTAHGEIPLVQVEGHTDNVGKPEKNKTLSQARAEAVRDYLVKKGVATERLRPVGFGQERPAEPNDTAKGRDANRRVEFNLPH